jgi:hypothetical protein
MGFHIWVQGIEESYNDYVKNLFFTTLQAMVVEVFCSILSLLRTLFSPHHHPGFRDMRPLPPLEV